MAEIDQIEHHNDILGRPLAVGDCVACSVNHGIKIAQVIKLTPKMVKVKQLGKPWKYNKYAHDLIKVEGPEVSFYLLKSGG